MSSIAFSIIGGGLLALLLVGYFGQKYLPPPKPKLVGIDLGTTYSCIGVYHAVSGKVEILPDDKGHYCIPSVVAFNDKGEILVGYDAINQADHNPYNTIYDAKRFIGKIFTEKDLQKEAKRYPYDVFLDKEGYVKFNIQLKRLNKTLIISPEMIGSSIITQLRKTAESRLEISITKAVMSVPAEFDQIQRNITKNAAKLSGIDVLRVINEPTAAALAYGLHNKTGVYDVLVIDLGGGTLDVSLLDIQGGMFLTRAMAGNNHLGGQDFNERLKFFVLVEIEQRFKKSLIDAEDLQALRSIVEKVKIELTNFNSVNIRMLLNSFNSEIAPSIIDNEIKNELNNNTIRTNGIFHFNLDKNLFTNKGEKTNIKNQQSNILNHQKVNNSNKNQANNIIPFISDCDSNLIQHNFEMIITRDDFERVNEDLFLKVLEPIDRVLQEGDLSSLEVEEIVLVGGSTRVPKVRELIENFFGKPPNVAIDPELAVVTGVSVQAGILGGAWPLMVSAIETQTAVKKIYLH